MSIIATAVKHLMAAGVTGDALVTAIAEMEAANAKPRSSGAERQARYRERKLERGNVTSDVTSVTTVTDETAVPSPLVPPLSPAPLSPPIIPPTSQKQAKRGTRVPENFQPDERAFRLADDLGVAFEEIQSELSKFLDYWRSVPGAKGLKLDWQGTFRNWLRNYAERRPRNYANGTRNTPKPNSIDDIFGKLHAVNDEIERREQESSHGNR